jgi:hypothetical protein
MADVEVESTLREIRERVLADTRLRANGAADGEAAGQAGDGAGGGDARPPAGTSGEALARLDANLATTARAWSRLPPLLTYRSGFAARLELWLKRLVKRAAHWFTWEQVNFNSAVHHALGDVRAVLGEVRAALGDVRAALAAEEQARARTREELLAELRAGRAEAEAERARVAELQARLAHAEARFDAGAAQLRQALAAAIDRLAEEQCAAAADSLAAQSASSGEIRKEQSAQIEARAAELHEEIRRRADGLLEEQRVCFKQLSLEASEAAVAQDRARRQLEARLEALEQNRER